jgi:hypothetical protein
LTVRSVNSEPFPPKDLPPADPFFPSLQQLSLSTHSHTLPQISWPYLTTPPCGHCPSLPKLL